MTLACLDYIASQSCTELGPAQPQLVPLLTTLGKLSKLKAGEMSKQAGAELGLSWAKLSTRFAS